MTDMTPLVKPAVANLKNVAACFLLVEKLRSRSTNVTGIGVFHGHSGYGKTFAAIFAQNSVDAVRVELGDSWSKTKFLRSILLECGMPERKIAKTIAAMADQVKMEFASVPGRLLIIDEADFAVDKNMVELIREIHKDSHAPLLLIGEELLPDKLEQSEKTHNRVLYWVQAQPCDLEDTETLARHYCDGIDIASDLQEHIKKETDGITRRICANLENIRQHCINYRLESFDRASFESSDLVLHVGRRAKTVGRR